MQKLQIDLEKLKQEYLSGLSCSKLAKMYNVCTATISKYLKQIGITIVNNQNKSKFNEHIFDSIDTEEKAYWLGFIYADGCVTKNRNQFEISLKGSDVNHLYKFNKFMQYQGNNVKMGTVNCNGKICTRCRWSIVNKHLKERLIEIGCVPNKSLILKFPNLTIFSDKKLVYSFIRGYFDGDGSLFNSGNRIIIKIIGTKEFLTSLNSIFPSKVIKKDPRTKSNTYSYDIYKRSDVLTFLNLIYKNANIFLDRKYQKYINICRVSQE